MDVWNKLSPKMKQWVDDEIQVYSRIHHAAIQKADMEAWGKFEKAGTQINRLPVEDLDEFQRVAVPIWFKWANKDKDAARLFKLQLDVMELPDRRLRRPRHVQGPEARSLIATAAAESRVSCARRPHLRRPRVMLRVQHNRGSCPAFISCFRTGSIGALIVFPFIASDSSGGSARGAPTALRCSSPICSGCAPGLSGCTASICEASGASFSSRFSCHPVLQRTIRDGARMCRARVRPFEHAQVELNRAKPSARTRHPAAAERLPKAQADVQAKAKPISTPCQLEQWHSHARWLACCWPRCCSSMRCAARSLVPRARKREATGAVDSAARSRHRRSADRHA